MAEMTYDFAPSRARRGSHANHCWCDWRPATRHVRCLLAMVGMAVILAGSAAANARVAIDLSYGAQDGWTIAAADEPQPSGIPPFPGKTGPVFPSSPATKAPPSTQTPPSPAPKAPASTQTPPSSAPVDMTAIRSMLSGMKCTLTHASWGSGELSVTGFAGSGEFDAKLRLNVTGLVNGGTVNWRVSQIEHSTDYCRTLDILRAANADIGTLAINLQSSGTSATLTQGDPVRLSVRMPPFKAVLRLDYLSSDGNTQHIYRVHDEQGLLKPSQEILPGAKGFIGNVGWPFGTDLVLAVASSVPLKSASPHPGSEQTSVALDELQATLERAKQGGAQLAAAILVLTTTAHQ